MAHGTFKRQPSHGQAVQTNDVTDGIHKYQQLRVEYEEINSKPVLLFVGDSGVGKSSCIAAILNLTQEQHGNILKELNVSTHGEEGTKQMVEVEGEHLVCVDLRGKRREETDSQYRKYVENIIKKRTKDIHLIVGVVRAYEDRDFDIDALVNSLRFLCVLFEKPFMVLMNQADRIISFERFDQRQETLKNMSKDIAVSQSWYALRGETMNQGIFSVAARPSAQMATECPREKPSEDPFAAPHRYGRLCPGIRYCSDCNEADIAKELMDLKEKQKFAKLMDQLVNEKHAKINHVTSGNAIGLNLGDPAITTAENLMNVLGSVAIIKTKVRNLRDRIKHVPRLIERILSYGVYSQGSAQEADKDLYQALASCFDLPSSGMTQGQNEYNRWEKAIEEWRIRAVWRFITRDHILEYYLAAWGIHYALRFYEIAVTIMSGFANATDTDLLVRECQKVADRHAESCVHEYLDYMIKENDRQKAYNKYLLSKVK